MGKKAGELRATRGLEAIGVSDWVACAVINSFELLGLFILLGDGCSLVDLASETIEDPEEVRFTKLCFGERIGMEFASEVRPAFVVFGVLLEMRGLLPLLADTRAAASENNEEFDEFRLIPFFGDICGESFDVLRKGSLVNILSLDIADTGFGFSGGGLIRVCLGESLGFSYFIFEGARFIGVAGRG